MFILCGKKAIAKIARHLFRFILILVTRRYTLSGDKRARLFIFGLVFVENGFVVRMHTQSNRGASRNLASERLDSLIDGCESRRAVSLYVVIKFSMRKAFSCVFSAVLHQSGDNESA